MGYHECWSIVNENTGCVVAFDDHHYCVYKDEGTAWETCLKIRKAYPDRKFTVRKNKLMLPWMS